MNVIILRRDLRLEDNWVFVQALANKEPLAIIFIYNQKQIDPQSNKYFSQNGFDFLNHSLALLKEKINLNVYLAKDDISVLNKIHQQKPITNLYVSQDLTSYAYKREAKIAQFCQKANINFFSHQDYFALPPNLIHNKNQSAFQVFKPFYQRYLQAIKNIKVYKYHLPTAKDTLKLPKNEFSQEIFEVEKQINLPCTIKQVHGQIDKQKNYHQDRDLLAKETSLISAALKFGLVSLRQVLLRAIDKHGLKSEFVRQLIWKEFYYHYYFYHRHHYLLEGKWSANIIAKYDTWKYDNNLVWLKRWKEGKTGIILVDAAMQQLNQTGYMHNRARMIVGSFLVKNLNIDWHYGEQYFATKLYDYDPIINNQSWQWVGFSGLNFQGNIRVFSPLVQQTKFDPNNHYVNKYLWNQNKIKPIVDLKETRQQFLNRWKKFHH